MEMMLDKMKIQVIFLFEFKMGHKTAETSCNIISAFGPVTANLHTVKLFKKFCKGDKNLENEEESSGQPLEVDNDQLR